MQNWKEVVDSYMHAKVELLLKQNKFYAWINGDLEDFEDIVDLLWNQEFKQEVDFDKLYDYVFDWTEDCYAEARSELHDQKNTCKNPCLVDHIMVEVRKERKNNEKL